LLVVPLIDAHRNPRCKSLPPPGSHSSLSSQALHQCDDARCTLLHHDAAVKRYFADLAGSTVRLLGGNADFSETSGVDSRLSDVRDVIRAAGATDAPLERAARGPGVGDLPAVRPTSCRWRAPLAESRSACYSGATGAPFEGQIVMAVATPALWGRHGTQSRSG
jgi:hypothetical protein